MEILINGKKTAIIKENSDDNIEYRKYMKREYKLIPCFILNKENIPVSTVDLPISFFDSTISQVKMIEYGKTYEKI
tara:strand:+ start:781 stop:1008 length:228 start_codon:yes stop_codon:yes gene_type:complete